jgi:tetratricopeptide (TPR) repeat protein
MALEDGRHPEAERLAEYADGVLDAGARGAVEQHLADCADCRAVVMETMAFLESNLAIPASATPPIVVPFRARRWVRGVAIGLAAAATLVLAIRVAQPQWVDGLFGPRGDRPELQELIAAVANEPTRPVEGRLSGGFNYAPPPMVVRGGVNPGLENLGLVAAVAARRSAVDANPSGENLHALGVAQVLAGKPDEALATFADAARLLPRNAPLQSDVSTAYLATANARPDREAAEKALAAADLALTIEPGLVAALFNRALAAERIASPTVAADAWKAFISAESDRNWKDEAQKHLAALLPRPVS